MGFFENLERLRQKPERERKRIAILTVITLTAIIAILWIRTLRFGEPEKSTRNAPGPLRVIGAIFGESAKSIKETFSREVASSTIYQNQRPPR